MLDSLLFAVFPHLTASVCYKAAWSSDYTIGKMLKILLAAELGKPTSLPFGLVDYYP